MNTLSEVFRTKLIPWSRQNAGERFIVARKKMRQTDMPYGVELTSHKIQSKRTVVKNRRNYSNLRNVVAEWPESGLIEIGKYTLTCVLNGDVDYQLGDYRVQCGPSHFFFIPPGVPQPNGAQSYVDARKSTSCDIITFLLHPNALECWICHNRLQGHTRSDNYFVLRENATILLQGLMKEVIGGEKQSIQIGEELLRAFLMTLAREADAGKFQQYHAANQLAVKSPRGDFRAHLESYVRDNLCKPLTLDMAATEMYFSRAQFVRVVRRETGQSFNEFIAGYRISEAKELLCNTEWTVSAIASIVGMKSHRYFRTFFKRHTGLTPTEFRTINYKRKFDSI